MSALYSTAGRPLDRMSKYEPSGAITYEIARELKLRSALRSSMHPWPGNYVAIGRAVVYCARAAHAFSSGIRCRHCIASMQLKRLGGCS